MHGRYALWGDTCSFRTPETLERLFRYAEFGHSLKVVAALPLLLRERRDDCYTPGPPCQLALERGSHMNTLLGAGGGQTPMGGEICDVIKGRAAQELWESLLGHGLMLAHYA